MCQHSSLANILGCKDNAILATEAVASGAKSGHSLFLQSSDHCIDERSGSFGAMLTSPRGPVEGRLKIR